MPIGLPEVHEEQGLQRLRGQVCQRLRQLSQGPLGRRSTNLFGVPPLDLRTGDNHDDFENSVMIPEIKDKIQKLSKSIRKTLPEMFPIRSQRQERGQEYMNGDKKEAKVQLNQL